MPRNHRDPNVSDESTNASEAPLPTPSPTAEEEDSTPSPTPKQLGLLMFNPHGECFMRNAHTCTEAFTEFTNGLLLHNDSKYGPIDFGTLAYTNGKYKVPEGWGQYHYVCKGHFIDDVMMVYKKSAWKPVEGAQRSYCMEKKGRDLSRPYIVQAFTQILPTSLASRHATSSTDEPLTVVVVSGHFPHRAGMKTALQGLTKAVDAVKEASGADKVITIVDSNLGNSNGGRNPNRRRMAVPGPQIMEWCCGAPKGSKVMSSEIAFTCCGRAMNIDGYDRIMASFGSNMETILPFKKAPSWSRNNFHLPMLAYLDY
jgi:hypothetical protein